MVTPAGGPGPAPDPAAGASARYEGGCLCGAVRYAIAGEPLSADWCHCRICQRSTGTPAVAWATFRLCDFAFTAGTPAAFASSPIGLRRLCPDCGTPLTFEYRDDPQEIDVTIASLDRPELIRPANHIWTASRIPWLVLDPTLPDFPDAGPDRRIDRRIERK